MLVVDDTRSEKEPQRRVGADGRPLHCCCVCGKLSTWKKGWSAFYSFEELDDGKPFPKFCSERCRDEGGADAVYITDKMILLAKAAEYRDPEIVYREQTEKEKYGAAVSGQKRKRP